MGNTVIWKPSPTQTLAGGAHDAAARGGRAAAGRDQPADRGRPRDLRGAAGRPRAGRDPLHRLVGDVPAPVARGRQQHRHLRDLSPAGRRDRRQGLRASPTPAPTSTCCAPRSSAGRSSTRGRSARRRRGRSCRARVWARLRDDLVEETEALPMGDVADFGNFMGAVIDRRSFDKLRAAIDQAHADPSLEVVAGGTADDSTGYFVRPTIVVGGDPTNEVFRTEYFGPAAGAARLRRRRLRRRCWTGRPRRAVRADRRGDRATTVPRSSRRPRHCGSPRGTSTSTTSRPVRSSASSPSAAGGRRARTTRPARSTTCCAGSAPARSRRPSSPRPSPPTPTRADPRTHPVRVLPRESLQSGARVATKMARESTVSSARVGTSRRANDPSRAADTATG